MTDEVRRGLREALKVVAVALKRADVPFALTGGYAVWARGGPEPEHDVDFLVAESDEARIEEHLRDTGLEVVRPAEDWLFKVFVEGAMVDVLYRANGDPVPRERFDDIDVMEVESVQMPVLGATSLVIDKLNALDERACDLGKVLPAARAVREQVDWPAVEEATAENDFAVATLFLLRRLGVVGAA